MVAARYSQPPPFREAVVIASGPSLSKIDVTLAMMWRQSASGRAAIAVNTSYRAAPKADLLYAGDKAWFDVYAVDALKAFKGEVWTGSDAAAREWPDVHLVRRVHGDTLPADGICVGGQLGNSGLQAICFAALCGAGRIALLGFDGGPAGGRTHWHEAHAAPLKPCYESETWPAMFARAAEQLSARGVEVTNCSAETKLTCFRRGRLSDWASL